MDNTCVMCGVSVPEGWMVCPACEKAKKIIKALECCRYGGGCEDGCPYREVDGCNPVMFNDAIALINRQKAEVEVLKGWERLLKAESHAPIIKKTKAEACKEFAERLKKEAFFDTGWCVMPTDCIDNLVKEMVGEGNG